jgi:hypothetical protein
MGLKIIRPIWHLYSSRFFPFCPFSFTGKIHLEAGRCISRGQRHSPTDCTHSKAIGSVSSLPRDKEDLPFKTFTKKKKKVGHFRPFSAYNNYGDNYIQRRSIRPGSTPRRAQYKIQQKFRCRVYIIIIPSGNSFSFDPLIFIVLHTYG